MTTSPLKANQSAEIASLHYTSDTTPGILRKKVGKGFSYQTSDGKAIKDRETLARINSLAIPPAYQNVWICSDPHGHLQATGIDARGRKQYRYHPRWREVRDENKYHRILEFAKTLPKIRQKTESDLTQRGFPRTKVLAAIVQLLEKTLIRVGNEEYARENASYGLTTLRTEHLEVEGSDIHFHFKGKSNKYHQISLHDRRLAKIVQRLGDLPGQELFQYQDHEGNVHNLTSSDVNAYIQEITGKDFTAKDFRTWTATVLAATALQEFERFDSKAQAKRHVTQAIRQVSSSLGNTPAICRKSYIHPAIIQNYLDGATISTLRQEADSELSADLADLKPSEAAVLAFLEKQLQLPVDRPKK